MFNLPAALLLLALIGSGHLILASHSKTCGTNEELKAVDMVESALEAYEDQLANWSDESRSTIATGIVETAQERLELSEASENRNIRASVKKLSQQLVKMSWCIDYKEFDTFMSLRDEVYSCLINLNEQVASRPYENIQRYVTRLMDEASSW